MIGESEAIMQAQRGLGFGDTVTSHAPGQFAGWIDRTVSIFS